MEVLYADFDIESQFNDMFVITPEGNYFDFPGDTYDAKHQPEIITDPKSHKQYTVVFNE